MEVKLQLAKLAIQKEEVIRSQRYEQAADIRIEEKRLTNLLLDQRLMLI
jgi:protein-arginine kinase activator protein McsA